ncbi:protease Do-like 8, chloroplastic isoform X1 [Hevea brasiliensis]|uniref:protease Do-like 8, chloroplastic isoform X1 n=1 Tax=Hevea brasiliensis TaxID=3981 RepID=UPI0025F96364|nr:protease Do-like 8, chloroplastic isoform X1 [Hevea brasiliensis]
MQMLACNSWSLQKPLPHGTIIVPRRFFLGRRQLLSSVCLCSDDSSHDIVSSHSISISRAVRDGTKCVYEEICKNSPIATRRMLLTSLFMYLWYYPTRYLSAQALGDPSVTIEEVTPPVFASGALFPTEERTVQLFEKNTYSVVNIFDVTLRPQLNVTGVVEIPEGNGSGVVWDAQGHIVTNYHVIGNALSRHPSSGQVVARVNILTSEGVQKNFEGKLIGADRTKDLAVLKVEASKDLLRPIKVGQSSSLRVGQQCLAIGNPFGFDHTLTVGVISGLNRDIFSQTGVTIGGGIQTDAAINPGNSGGPLLDSKGNLIGINTAIFTQTGTSAGVGFAIPSSTVLKIVPQLIQFGKVVRAGLTVEIAPDLVSNQLNIRNGALILQVPGNSLAAKAGLLPTTRGFAGNIVLGDIIIAVDNKPVKSKAELYKVLDDYNVGDTVVLKIQRGGDNLELPITLEEKSS